MEELTKSILHSILIIILLPIILLVVLLLIPLFIIGFLWLSIKGIKNKVKLKQQIKSNNGKLFFIYADYNQIELSEYLNQIHPNIICVKVVKNGVNGLFQNHLIKNCKRKSFPRLIKIQGKDLIYKEHYNSFKHFVKRNQDLDGFYSLLDKSIKNLKE